jgi:hypothetical protein
MARRGTGGDHVIAWFGTDAIDDHSRIDVLVNNVGAVRLRLDSFLGTSDDEFEWAMQTVRTASSTAASSRRRNPAPGRPGLGACIPHPGCRSFESGAVIPGVHGT